MCTPNLNQSWLSFATLKFNRKIYSRCISLTYSASRLSLFKLATLKYCSKFPMWPGKFMDLMVILGISNVKVWIDFFIQIIEKHFIYFIVGWLNNSLAVLFSSILLKCFSWSLIMSSVRYSVCASNIMIFHCCFMLS